MRSTCKRFIVALVLLIGSPVFAGVTVEYVTQAPDSGVMERIRFQIQDGNLRFSTQGGMVGTATSDFYLYNHGSRRLRFVQPGLNRYHELDPGMLDSALSDLRAQRDRLQELLDGTLADATPEQRRPLEDALSMIDQALAQTDAIFMDGSMGESRLLGRTGSLTLDGIDCEVHEVLLYNNQFEVCFAAAGALGLEPLEVEVIQAFQQRLTEVTGMANLYSLLPGSLPLAASYGQLGATGAMTTLLRGVERSNMPRSLFSMPSHYSPAIQP